MYSPTALWNEMYNLYLKNLNVMNECYITYNENMKETLYKSSEASQKMNETSSDELSKSNQNVTNLYASYMEFYQKLANQWIDTFWRPYFMSVEAQQGASRR